MVTGDPVIRRVPTLARPLFQTCSEVGEERYEFGPEGKINLPKGACHSFLEFYFRFLYRELRKYIQYVHMYTSLWLLVDLLSSHHWPQIEKV